MRRGRIPETMRALAEGRSLGPTVPLQYQQSRPVPVQRSQAGVSQNWSARGERPDYMGSGGFVSNLVMNKLSSEKRRREKAAKRAAKEGARQDEGGTPPTTGGQPSSGGPTPTQPSGGVPPAAAQPAPYIPPSMRPNAARQRRAPASQGGSPMGNIAGANGPTLGRPQLPQLPTYSNPAANPNWQPTISQGATRDTRQRDNSPVESVSASRLSPLGGAYVPPSARAPQPRARRSQGGANVPAFTAPESWNWRIPNLPPAPTQAAGEAARKQLGLPSFADITSGRYEASKRDTEISPDNPPTVPPSNLGGMVGTSQTAGLATGAAPAQKKPRAPRKAKTEAPKETPAEETKPKSTRKPRGINPDKRTSGS